MTVPGGGSFYSEIIIFLTFDGCDLCSLLLCQADSKSVNDIAEILNLSPKTVGHHCTSVKKKLGVSDIAALTRLAIRLGIITP